MSLTATPHSPGQSPVPYERAGSALVRPAAPFWRTADFWLALLARASAVLVLVMLATLVSVLLYSAAGAIKTYGLSILTGTEWRPNEREITEVTTRVNDDGEVERLVKVLQTLPPKFGALPAIYGTAISSLIALVFAVPLSFGAALFLVRMAPRWIATPVSFLIEFLAAIPSIAYGLWGLFVLSPFLLNHVLTPLRNLFGTTPGLAWLFSSHTQVGQRTVEVHYATGNNLLTAGVILAIMVVPIITAVSRDILKTVPRVQIEGTLALGATWWQSCMEMIRYSRSALFGAVMLGLARAAGETMAVTMVIGNAMDIRPSPFAPSQTMSALLANEFAESNNDLHLSALKMVAVSLLLMSLLFNVVARWLVVGGNSRSAAAH
ncbi:MAG: phosphate ABC transporter permease subunit PstC [Tepidisphaeraceae bacterium]